MSEQWIGVYPNAASVTDITRGTAPSSSTSSLQCHNSFYSSEDVAVSCTSLNNMPSIAHADTPPLRLERKLTSTIRQLRSGSSNHQQRPFTTFDTSRSQMGLHRLTSMKNRGKDSLTNEEALFFLGLPDKVRRQYFSREEIILFRAACEINLSRSPGYDNVFGRQRPGTASRPGTGHSASASLSTGKTRLMRSRTLSDSTNSTDSDVPPSTPNFSLPRRRPMSVMSTTTDTTPESPESHLPSRFASSHYDMSKDMVKRPGTAPKQAKYYLDSKTRNKIRQHLASPEAFDEMIAFGFAADDDGEEENDGITSSPDIPNSILHEDGTMKHSQFDEDEDYLSVDSDDEPLTPNFADAEFEYHNPVPLHREASSFSFPSPERHMTLRVTLTKPEVRSHVNISPCPSHNVKNNDTAVKSVEVQEDALALERLTFSDDVTGMRGAFAVSNDEKGIKKLWKRVQLQRSTSSMSGV